MANKLHPLSAPRAGFAWGANAREIDMAMPPAKPVPLKISAAPQNITVDLKRTAMIVIDMQNDFCAKGGWVDYLGADYTPDRKPIKPLQKLLPALRKAREHAQRVLGITHPVDARRQLETAYGLEQKGFDLGAALAVAPVADPDDIALAAAAPDRAEQPHVGGLMPGPDAPPPAASEVQLAHDLAKGQHAVIGVQGETAEVMRRGDGAVVRVVEQERIGPGVRTMPSDALDQLGRVPLVN